MPVMPRQKSESGYYHLILRGNGKQIIFEEESDYIHFLNNLKQYSEEHKIKINAYCLMENHIHLLIYAGDQDISLFMKRLAGNYALWFNRKYQQKGHLFESRYTGIAIESEYRLCTVFRYILNNPRDAGICPTAEYPWSSYAKYGHPNSFVDTKVLVEIIGSFEEYNAYLNEKYDDDSEIQTGNHDDNWAMEVIRKTCHVESCTMLKSFDLEKRNAAIRLLRDKGLSIRQIERLTGISKGSIQRASAKPGDSTEPI